GRSDAAPTRRERARPAARVRGHQLGAGAAEVDPQRPPLPRRPPRHLAPGTDARERRGRRPALVRPRAARPGGAAGGRLTPPGGFATMAAPHSWRGDPMSILGTRVLRTEDPRFLTVGGSY